MSRPHRPEDVGFSLPDAKNSLTASFIEHAPLILLLTLIAVAYGGVSFAFPSAPPLDDVAPGELRETALTILLTIAILGAGYGLIYILRIIRQRSTAQLPALSEDGDIIRQLLGLIIVIAWYNYYILIFDSLKALIPLVHPFHLDPLFLDIDRLVHVGYRPDRVLHNLLRSDMVTAVVDRLYILWYPVTVAFVLWEAWNPNRRLRFRFLVCLGLVWFLLGNLLATVLSSAGPIYYGRLYSSSPYEELVAYLSNAHKQSPLYMWHLQSYLWDGYISKGDTSLGAISAMPSIHVAIATLLALRTHHTHWVPRILLWTFVGITLFSSVYLGWHYAIDGYAAIALTVLLWKASGLFTNWYWRRHNIL